MSSQQSSTSSSQQSSSVSQQHPSWSTTATQGTTNSQQSQLLTQEGAPSPVRQGQHYYMSLPMIVEDTPLSEEDRRYIKEELEEELWPNPHSLQFISDNLRESVSTRTSSTDPSSPRNVFTHAQSLCDHLDEIDPEIIGGIAPGLPELTQKAPTFARPILELIREDKPGQRPLPPLPLREKSSIEQRVSSKGTPRQRISPIIADAFWLFLSDPKYLSNSLFSSDNELAHLFHLGGEYRRGQRQIPDPDTAPKDVFAAYEKSTHFFHAGIFTVNKADPCDPSRLTACTISADVLHYLQRIVVDGRPANAHLENPAHMELFRLDVLFDCFARCKKVIKAKLRKTNGKSVRGIFTISADLRHWFHQIPMPRRFRGAYGIDLGKNRIVFPNTWCMGASPAAGIGQAITWSMILSGLDTSDIQRRASLGIDWPADRPFDSYLPWLPLTCGGGVFVLIDNIYIVTTEQRFADAWEKRIEAVTNHFNARLKVLDKENNKKILRRFLSPSSGETSEFTGVIFSWHGRKPRSVVSAVPALDDLQSSLWTTSFRNLASVIGQCLWFFRILGKPTYNNRNYKRVARIAFPSPLQSWDTERDISGDDLTALKEMYQRCRDTNASVEHPETLTKVEHYALVATDASYKDRNGPPESCTGFAYSFGHMGDTNPPEERHIYTVRGDRVQRRSQIAIEELRAISLALKHIKQTCEAENRPFPHLFVIGVDSAHARSMITDRIARTQAAVDLLDDIFDTLGPSRIYLTHVPSKENPADALSRPDLEWDISKWNTLVERLDSLVPLAVCDMVNRAAHVMHQKVSLNRKSTAQRRDRE